MKQLESLIEKLNTDLNEKLNTDLNKETHKSTFQQDSFYDEETRKKRITLYLIFLQIPFTDKTGKVNYDEMYNKCLEHYENLLKFCTELSKDCSWSSNTNPRLFALDTTYNNITQIEEPQNSSPEEKFDPDSLFECFYGEELEIIELRVNQIIQNSTPPGLDDAIIQTWGGKKGQWEQKKSLLNDASPSLNDWLGNFFINELIKWNLINKKYLRIFEEQKIKQKIKHEENNSTSLKKNNRIFNPEDDTTKENTNPLLSPCPLSNNTNDNNNGIKQTLNLGNSLTLNCNNKKPLTPYQKLTIFSLATLLVAGGFVALVGVAILTHGAGLPFVLAAMKWAGIGSASKTTGIVATAGGALSSVIAATGLGALWYSRRSDPINNINQNVGDNGSPNNFFQWSPSHSD